MLAVLSVAATVYGIAGALAILMQARQIWARHASCDVSLRFLAVYVGGYALWLAYGLALHNLTIILADSAGTACGAFTLAVAVTFHHSCAATRKGNTS